ncbi:MAG: YdcF family protein [Alphaproteobacteria bacterium]|uniref:YdcF family protein n=1 Tax=Candidatus Nitrobium versatile TaxID=2884831 RepID=A0A953JBB9_9BACT|nr:YdcF family protein [Candidatus Nitrobium versatile]
MFLIKKIISPFLLPPGIFILVLLFSGFLFLRGKCRKAGVLNILLGVSLWLLSIAPVSDVLIGKLEAGFSLPENPKGDVIVLLGGGVYDNAPDMTGVGVPSEEMLGRIITAVRLQKKLRIPVVVSSGIVYSGRRAEAPVVKRFLMDLGVPEREILLEDRSRDTIENARYTKEICGKFGFKRPILVTSAFHMKRSLMSFEKVHLKVVPFPANFKTWGDKKYGWHDYLPDISGLWSVYAGLREFLGLLFYRLVY